MKDATFAARKAALKGMIAELVKGRSEVGLKALRRDLYNGSMATEPLAQQGLFVAKMLNALGWRREGWLGTGYDREQRYVPVEKTDG